MKKKDLPEPWKSRSRRQGITRVFLPDFSTDTALYDELDESLVSEFTGYDTLQAESSVAAIASDGKWQDVLSEGQEGTIIT